MWWVAPRVGGSLGERRWRRARLWSWPPPYHHRHHHWHFYSLYHKSVDNVILPRYHLHQCTNATTIPGHAYIPRSNTLSLSLSSFHLPAIFPTKVSRTSPCPFLAKLLSCLAFLRESFKFLTRYDISAALNKWSHPHLPLLTRAWWDDAFVLNP